MQSEPGLWFAPQLPILATFKDLVTSVTASLEDLDRAPIQAAEPQKLAKMWRDCWDNTSHQWLIHDPLFGGCGLMSLRSL